jgi:hypothetical protein
MKEKGEMFTTSTQVIGRAMVALFGNIKNILF